MNNPTDWLRAGVCFLICCLAIDSTCLGQSRDRKKREEAPPTEKELQIRLEKAEAALVSEYKDVAVELYNQGDREKSMQMLRRLKQLSPQLEGLDDQIKTISEEVLSDNKNEFDLDTRKSWELVGDVLADKKFRIAAEGEVKLTFSVTVGPSGLTTKKDAADYVANVPLGTLMGVIAVDGKPGKPFPIRNALEYTPRKSGQLYIKVNVPPETRCVGKLKIKVSGYIQSTRKR